MRASSRVLYRAGALTAIHIPTEQEEAARDLLRCREDIRTDLLRARHRLSKFSVAARPPLHRHASSAWSKRHEAWLRGVDVAPPGARRRRTAPYLRAVDEPSHVCATVETRSARVARRSSRCRPRRRLRCFRGINDLTALTIAAELGDARRFPTAPRTMAFVGLVPSEHSSGTQTGPWRHYQNRQCASAPRPRRSRLALSPPSASSGATLRRRQRGAPRRARPARLDRATAPPSPVSRLAARGKPKQHVVTAVARELTGFVWAALDAVIRLADCRKENPRDLYAIDDFGLELALLEPGSSRRTTVMRYPTREYQSDAASQYDRRASGGAASEQACRRADGGASATWSRRPSTALQPMQIVLSSDSYARAASAAFTRSGVNGTSRRRAPVASKIALPIAAATIVIAVSPAPDRLVVGPVDRARSRSPARRRRAAGCGRSASRPT